MKVEVVYALPEQQFLIELELPPKSTVSQAIEAAKLLEHYPDLNLTQCGLGIFSQPAKLDTQLSAGDRVEIYRPLLADPKQARRKRV